MKRQGEVSQNEYFSWLCGDQTVTVGLFTAANGRRFSAFVDIDFETEVYSRARDVPIALYMNQALWHVIALKMETLGYPLVHKPVANCVSSPTSEE